MNIFIQLFIFLYFFISTSNLFSQENGQTSSQVDEKKEEVLPVAPESSEPINEVSQITPSTPTPMVTSEIVDEDEFVPKKSHWIVNFGFEGIEYEVPLSFNGDIEDFNDQKRKLYGGRLGFGRELYLGWGFNTTSRVEGFYMGTLFQNSLNPNTDEVDDSYYIKDTGHIFGAELSQSLGFLFDMKTKNPLIGDIVQLTVEPYIFAGVGEALAYNRLSYHYEDTLSEDYRIRVKDAIRIASVGGGINFSSNSGYFLYLKATQYRLNIIERKEEGYSRLNGQSTVLIDSKTQDLDPKLITVYAIGGGYKF